MPTFILFSSPSRPCRPGHELHTRLQSADRSHSTMNTRAPESRRGVSNLKLPVEETKISIPDMTASMATTATSLEIQSFFLTRFTNSRYIGTHVALFPWRVKTKTIELPGTSQTPESTFSGLKVVWPNTPATRSARTAQAGNNQAVEKEHRPHPQAPSPRTAGSRPENCTFLEVLLTHAYF